MASKYVFMILSMTGYGKKICNLENKDIIIEVRSLNSKNLEVNLKIHSVYKEKELEIRQLISSNLNRGKIELSVYLDNQNNDKTTTLNSDLIVDYYKQLKSIYANLNIEPDSSMMPSILRFPDSIKSTMQELDEEEWISIKNHIQLAVDELIKFRKQEGQALYNDLTSHNEAIIKLLEDITPFEENRVNNIKARITKNLQKNFDSEELDKNRFEQEVLFYLEKLDISEEKVRLKNHCSYFTETMVNEENNGKKLGFICQEINREINTIGSKANDADIQRIIVMMKDELEKIKEQLANVL